MGQVRVGFRFEGSRLGSCSDLQFPLQVVFVLGLIGLGRYQVDPIQPNPHDLPPRYKSEYD